MMKRNCSVWRQDNRVNSSRFQFPYMLAEFSACLQRLWKNVGVIKMLFPQADTFPSAWKCGDILWLQSYVGVIPARDKASCGDTLFRLTCKAKLSVKIWVLFHFRLSRDICHIVQVNTQSQRHMPGIPCMGFNLQISRGKRHTS